VLALLLTVAAVGPVVPQLMVPAGAAIGDPATGSSLQLPEDAVVLHVDAGAAGGFMLVSPDGSTARPYPTISSAITHAQSLRKQGAAVHVIVEPGTYRETISVDWAGDAARPLVIEAAQPGSVIVSGADVEQRWSPVLGTTFVSSPWDQDWGLAPIPAGWGEVDVPYLVRRREAVFVDGTPLVQVASRSALTPGTFVVDETLNQLIVDPPSGMADLTGHHVEVARRDRTLHIKGLARAVAVKGFVFEAAAAGLEKHMAYVSDSTNVLIEGNTFRHSSWGGLGVCCTQGITVRGSQSVANGGNGIDTYKTHNALIEGNHIAGNNVRGGPQGFTGWSTAGSKNLLLHGAVFRGNTYEGNLARGLWFDTDVQNVLVDGDRSCENLRDGLFVEAVQGPLTIQDSTFCDNNGAGIIVATSGNVRVERSILSDNRYGQLVFSGPRTRSWSDHVSKAFISMGDFDNWTLVENTLSTTGTAPLVYSPTIPVADWRGLLAAGEIRATANSWWRPSMDGVIRIQVTSYLLDEWRSATGDSAIVLSASPDPTTTTTTTTTTTRAPKPFKQKGGPGRK
jgi:hypothetical protein